MKRLWWEIEHALPYLGLPGILGIVFIILAMFMEFGLRPGLEAKREEANAEIARISLKPLRTSPVVVEEDPLKGFSPVKEVPKRMQDIMRLAAAEGLAIPRGQYQAQHPEAGSLPLVRYVLTLPLSGNYQAIRRFSEQVRKEVPGLALTQLSFARDAVQVPNAQATVEFTIWLTEEAR